MRLINVKGKSKYKKILVLVLLGLLSGCAHYSIPSSSLSQMQYGLSVEEADKILNKKGLLEFKFLLNNQEYLVKSYETRDTHKDYYFLYSGEGLEAVVERNIRTSCSQCTVLPLSADSNGQGCLKNLLNQFRSENILKQAYDYSDMDIRGKKEKKGHLTEIIAFSPILLPMFPVLFVASHYQNNAVNRVVSKVQSLRFGMSMQEVFDKLGNPPEHMVFNGAGFSMAGIPYGNKIMGRLPAVVLGFENQRLLWIDYSPKWACSDSPAKPHCEVHCDVF